MKILIIKTSALGDVIHAFPCLQYLRQKFPEAQIDWVVEKSFAELVQAHPGVNRALTVDTKQWRKGLFKKETRRAMSDFLKKLRTVHYDVVFDLQGNIKSGLICGFVKASFKVGFGKRTVPEWPNLIFSNVHYNPPKGQNIRLDYLHLLQSYFKDFSVFQDTGVLLRLQPEQKTLLEQIKKSIQALPGTKIMVCPGSAWPNKQLTQEGLLQLLHQLRKKRPCSFIFVWGTAQEKDYVLKLHEHFPSDSMVVDRMPLPVLQNLMGALDLVVAMDSLPLHLAGTTQVPTLSVFGASSAAKYKPEGVQHQSYQGVCPYGRTFEKRCPILRSCPTGACIHEFEPTKFDYKL